MFPEHWRVSIKVLERFRTPAFQSLLTAALCVTSTLICPLHIHAQEIPDVPEKKEWGVLLHSHAALDHDWNAVVSLQRAALSNGLSAIIMTDQLIAEWEWAPSFIRTFWSFRKKRNSIMRYGLEQYFESADEADNQVPEIILITGAEVAPYYYWTGVPWKKNLIMWNWQRNLLVLDLPDPADYGKLPLLGLRRSLIESWKDLPWLLMLVCSLLLFLWLLNRLYFFRSSIALIPVLLLIWSGPPAHGPFSQYKNDTGMDPYQTLIESVNTAGGIIIWSQVETIDDRNESWGGIRTEPHPQVLLETSDYQGFSTIYPSTATAHEPGQEWDRALLAYMEGTRSIPPWGWGELALHYPEQLPEKKIWEVQTVLLAPNGSRESLLNALRGGSGYAVRATHSDGRLRLDRFEAFCGSLQAGMGDNLTASGPVSIHAEWSYTGSGSPVVSVRLIRSGEVLVSDTGVTPMELSLTESGVGVDYRKEFYRLELTAEGHILLSNPIFVEYTGTAGVTDPK